MARPRLFVSSTSQPSGARACFRPMRAKREEITHQQRSAAIAEEGAAAGGGFVAHRDRRK